jgi:uncharacterized membrane protein YvlD (DUF360 family)
MLRFIVQFLVTCFGLWLSSRAVDGVHFLSNGSLLAAATRFTKRRLVARLRGGDTHARTGP